jgi:hypothetical protein
MLALVSFQGQATAAEMPRNVQTMTKTAARTVNAVGNSNFLRPGSAGAGGSAAGGAGVVGDPIPSRHAGIVAEARRHGIIPSGRFAASAAVAP